MSFTWFIVVAHMLLASTCDYRMKLHLLCLSKLLWDQSFAGLAAVNYLHFQVFPWTTSEISSPVFYPASQFLLLIESLQWPSWQLHCWAQRLPPVMVANICQEFTPGTHKPKPILKAPCGGWLPPLGEHEIYYLLRGGQRKGHRLSFLFPRHLTFCLKVKSGGGNPLSEMKLDPAPRVMKSSDFHSLTVPFPKFALLNFRQYPMWDDSRPEHQIYLFPCHRHFLLHEERNRIRIKQPSCFSADLNFIWPSA